MIRHFQACEVWHKFTQMKIARFRSNPNGRLILDAGNYATGGAGASCGCPIPCSSTGRVHRLVWQSRGEGLWSVQNEFWFLLLGQFMIWSPTMADAVGFCDDFHTSTFPTICWRMSYKKYSYVTSHKKKLLVSGQACFWKFIQLSCLSYILNSRTRTPDVAFNSWYWCNVFWHVLSLWRS